MRRLSCRRCENEQAEIFVTTTTSGSLNSNRPLPPLEFKLQLVRKQMMTKPNPQRRLINRQRFQTVKMPAWTLFRRAAGMEYRGAFHRLQTGQIQFLECRCRHSRNLRPMFDNSRRKATRFADFPVGSVVFELQRKEFEG